MPSPPSLIYLPCRSIAQPGGRCCSTRELSPTRKRPMMKKTLLLTLVLAWVTGTLPAQTFERYKTLTDTTLASAHLGFEKQLTVTVPLEWQEDIDRRFPLIVICDSQNKRSHGYMLHTIDYLTSNEQMPASVIVSVASTREYRYFETAYKASDAEGLAEEKERTGKG
jgi:hypothetical protein